MTTQRGVDIDALRQLAAEIKMDCTIEGDGDEITITMETGEVETADTYEEGARIMREYRSCGAA